MSDYTLDDLGAALEDTYKILDERGVVLTREEENRLIEFQYKAMSGENEPEPEPEPEQMN